MEEKWLFGLAASLLANIPIKIKIWVFSIKLHQGLGLNLVRLCTNFCIFLVKMVGCKLYSSFSCCDKSKPDRTLTRIRV